MGRLGDSEGRGQDAELMPRRVDALTHASARQASAGPFHAAVATTSGDVYVWGANFFGQLGRPNEVGVGENSSQEMAEKFESIGGVVVDAMDITVRTAVPPRPQGPGAHEPSEAPAPAAVPACVRALALVKAYTGHTARQVSCGGAHTIAVCDQGVALVFGCNAQGQLGTKPSPPPSSSGGTSSAHNAKLWSMPSELLLPRIFVVEASCGGMHSLLRSSAGLVYSFGEGRNGRLGLGDAKACVTPTLVPTFSSSLIATSICAAWAHSIAVDARGGVWTWGHGGSGRLGHGNTLDTWRARRVDVLHRQRLRVLRASSAYEHTGVCCSDGSVWMWGLGEHGQLGIGNTETHTGPVLLQSLATAQLRVVDLSCGGAHSAAVSDGGLLLTWGRGDWGQLGHKNRAGRLFGKVVHDLLGVRVLSVACGWGCTLAVTAAPDTSTPRDLASDATPEIGEIVHVADRECTLHGSADTGESFGEAAGAGAACSRQCTTANIAAELERLHLAGLESSTSNFSDCLTPDWCTSAEVASSRARGQGERAAHQGPSCRSPPAHSRPAVARQDDDDLVATIMGTRVIDGTRYYELAVRYGGDSWTIERRYRQLRQLHLALARLQPSSRQTTAAWAAASPQKLGIPVLPPFPPRVLHLKYAAAGSEADAEARRQLLQQYLDGITAMEGIQHNKSVQAFFDLSVGQQAGASAFAAGVKKAASNMGLLLWSPRQTKRAPVPPAWLGGKQPDSKLNDAARCSRTNARGHADEVGPQGRASLGIHQARPEAASRGWRLSEQCHSEQCHSEAEPASPAALPTAPTDEHHRRDSCLEDSQLDVAASRGGERGMAVVWSRGRVVVMEDAAAEEVAGVRGGSCQHGPPISHTDASMWKSYAYWVQEVAPQWELTLNLSPKKKQAMALVTSEGISALARGTIWPLCIRNKLQLNRDLFHILKTKARSASRSSSTTYACDEHHLSFGLEDSARLIETDLDRTMAQLGLFAEGGPYALELRDILEAYCFYRPDVGYVQGMSFAAAMLVMHCLDAFTAFSCFANVVSRPFFQCFFRHNDDFKAWCLQERLAIFDSIFLANLPTLHRHLASNDVGSEVYVRPWLMTLFAKQLPLPIAARVWDLYLVQGEGLLYRTAVAILRVLEPGMLGMQQDELLQLLLGDLVAIMPADPTGQKLFEAIEATRLSHLSTSALDRLLAREAVHEFKSAQLTIGL